MSGIKVGKSNRFRTTVHLFGVLLFAGVLTACGGGGGGGGSVAPATVDISGTGAKGPISSGTVTVYRLNTDGSRGESISSSVTSASGGFQFTVDPQAADYVVLVLTEGSYVDEASGNTISLGAGDELEAYARMPQTGLATVNITPLTHLAAEQARDHLANDGQALADAVSNANSEISAIFDVGDVLSTTLRSVTDLGGASPQEINYALLLAGVSQLDLDDGARSAFEVLGEMSADIGADGIWGNSASVFTPPSLASAINQFRLDEGIAETLSDKVVTILAQPTVDVEVSAQNVAPFISGSPATTVAEDSPYSFTPTFGDVDGDTLLFYLTGNPAWLSIDPATGLVSGTPTNSDVGTTTGILITVDDQQGQPNSTASLASFDLTVTNTNDAPTISGTPGTTVAQGSPYSFTPTSGDLDGDTLLFTIANNPAWMSIDPATGLVSGTPDNGDVATTTGIVITVDDQQGQPNSTASLAPFDLTVTNTNDAPTISGTPGTTVAEDSPYSFTPTSGDLDGDTLLFTIANNPAWLSIDPATGLVSGTPDNGDVATTTGIVITVDDQQGQPNSTASLAPFDLTVTNTNDVPTISGTPGTTLSEYEAYSFTPTSGDVDVGDTLLFTIANNPAWMSIDPATGLVSGTPDNGDVATTTGIVITVDDQQGQPNSTASLAAFDVEVLQGFNEALFAAASVSSSSTVERGFQANDGIDSVAANYWEADGPDVSPYIQLDFDTATTVYRVDLTDAVGTLFEAGLIEFSDGSSVAISAPLPDDGTQQIVFTPRVVDWVKVTVTQSTAFHGLAEIGVFSVLDSNQAKVAEDLFNDGNATGWSEVPNCILAPATSVWDPAFAYATGAGFQFQQTGNCRGFSVDGIEVGTYQLWTAPGKLADMDLRLQVRTDDTPDVEDRFAIGVLFGYQDDNNYYRMDLSQMEGHTKIWKKVAGVYTELNSSPQSYIVSAWENLRVVRQNGVILVYVNGEKVLAVEDTEFGAGEVALFCARNMACTFDNVVLLSSPSDPVVGLNVVDSAAHRSGEFFVDTDSSTVVSAVVTDNTGIGGVEFVVDGSVAGPAVLTPPYNKTLSLSTGEHTIEAYLLDGTSTRLTDPEATDTLRQVGNGGIHILTMGDSITVGKFDDIPADDISDDLRNTSGGYQPVLNNHLTSSNSVPVTILNEGNAGERSTGGADRIVSVLANYPEAEAILTIYGANDGGTLPTPTGLGLTCVDPSNPTVGTCDAGYMGSFKHMQQRMRNAADTAGKMLYLSMAPPRILNGGDPDTSMIPDYNMVTQELIDEWTLAGYYVGYNRPDFHTYYLTNWNEFFDRFHPDGTGYQSMARLWCDSLHLQLGWLCSTP